MSAQSSPIFVRGLSRSGGTLMCTLLDAHRDVAMSYELYPNLLETDEDVDIAALADKIGNVVLKRGLTKVVPTEKFGTFVLRCDRSGLSWSDFAGLLLRLAKEGGHTSTVNGRFRLMELCGLEKMTRVGKSRWGMKYSGSFDDYHAAWPKAVFLNMLRDGRDVLASQLNTGSFKNSPEKLGRSWSRTHENFAKLVDRDDVAARFMRYEELTANPETELRALCSFLELEFDEKMLNHSKQDLTVMKVRHLSGARLKKAIDTSMIGRWQKDLSKAQLEEFLCVAGPAMKKLGYV